jgi:hypothetical protein
MVRLFRLVVLVAVLALTFLGAATATGLSGSGTCYIPGENGYEPVWSTLDECCTRYGGYEWIGYGGGDYLCELYNR